MWAGFEYELRNSAEISSALPPSYNYQTEGQQSLLWLYFLTSTALNCIHLFLQLVQSLGSTFYSLQMLSRAPVRSIRIREEAVLPLAPSARQDFYIQ